jgi:hypothetical protein
MSEKIYVGKVSQKENKFGQVETAISFGPQDWEKIGVKFDGWKNFVLKSSKEGKPYVELNTWVPAEKKAEDKQSNDGLPF